MGFRFQKRITILPGLRINLSKSGASLSVGPRGASITVGKKGVYANAGIPGTGLSWRERLDTPGSTGSEAAPSSRPSSVSPDAAMEITGRIIGDELRLFDQRGQPLPPEMVKAARATLGDAIKSYLEEHERERNLPFQQLGRVHLDIPRTVATHCPGAAGKPDERNYPDRSAYMAALMGWRADQANQGVIPHNFGGLVTQQLSSLTWPYPTEVSAECSQGRLRVAVRLPALDDLPNYRWAAMPSRMGMVRKDLSQKDLAAVFLGHVCSILVRLIGHGMAASDQVGEVAISAATPRRSALGRVADECVATCIVSRNDWRQADLSQLAVIDPQNLLRMLRARIETNARGLLLVQTPIS